MKLHSRNNTRNEDLPRRQRRHRLRRWLVIAFVGCAVIGAAAHWMARPVQGKQVAVDISVHQQNSAPQPTQTPASTVGDQYFALVLPAGYSPKAPVINTNGLLYTQTITKPGDEGTLIAAIAIKNVPIGGLSGDSSYTLRTSQPARYSFTTQPVAADTAQIASDTQQPAMVAFWTHAGYEATVSVTQGFGDAGGTSTSEVARTMQVILTNWRWK